MSPRVWNVLGGLGHPAVAGERIEHLEVAGRSGQQLLVARLGEAAYGVVLRLVDRLSCFRHLDQPGYNELR
jgi:hypothetical protein